MSAMPRSSCCAPLGTHSCSSYIQKNTSVPHVDVANHHAGQTVGRAWLCVVAFIRVAGSPASLDRLAALQLALGEVGLGRMAQSNHLVMLKRDDNNSGPRSVRARCDPSRDRASCAPRAVITSTDRIAYGLMRA
jgi:hypothetical protein